MENKKMDRQGAENGMHPILGAYDKMIASYDLVIEDLSGEVYDPALQAQK